MNEIILHHYPQSPVSEKVRVGLGIKGLSWRSVEIPRLPPKPDLMPLTGGYRRTPVMQIGADIYCDSQCILRELERRIPKPSFFPGGSDGLPWGLARWSDGEMLDLAVRLVLGAGAAQLPEDFARDRGRLYLGPDGDPSKLAPDLPHFTAQLRAQLTWVEQRLGAGRRFLLGEEPGLPDALVYYLVWFLRGRWESGPRFLAQFPELESWEDRVREIGHGFASDMTAEAALEIARESTVEVSERDDSGDPQGLHPGVTVGITPLGDGGDPTVFGMVHHLAPETIAILRDDARIGRHCISFPRAGYRVEPTP